MPDPSKPGDIVLKALRPKHGHEFPALALIDPKTGEATDFSRWRQPGHRYLVNLWATWCVPCRLEMPELEKLYPELQAAGVDLLGISLDTGQARARVPRFLDRAGITYPNFTTPDSSLEQLFAGDQLIVPVSFVIDKQGNIRHIHAGYTAEEADVIVKEVEALLAEE